MTDRPIIFSAPMVRALLDGRKTQTRRLITPGTSTVLGSRVTAKSPAWAGLKFDRAEARTLGPVGTPRPHLAAPWVHPDDEANGMEADAIYRVDPIIQAGDRLYVREAFMLVGGGDPGNPIYRANWREDATARHMQNLPAEEPKGWRPSIHMPRWASRLTLEVTQVRVERLQDINEVDAIDEGAVTVDLPTHGAPTERGKPPLGQGPRARFAHLWNSINGPDAWAANPWVAAISFEVVKANIDALPARAA